MNVGEIATTPAGDFNFLSHPLIVFQQENSPAPMPCSHGAKHACGTPAYNHHIILRGGWMGVHRKAVVGKGL